MTEDADEVTFHMSLLTVQLRGLKAAAEWGPSTWPATVLPLLAAAIGTTISLFQHHPHLTVPVSNLDKSLAKLAKIEDGEPDPWIEIATHHAELLNAVKTPLPAWVRGVKP